MIDPGFAKTSVTWCGNPMKADKKKRTKQHILDRQAGAEGSANKAERHNVDVSRNGN